MKKKIRIAWLMLFVLLALVSRDGYAQITISTSDIVSAGDTMRISRATSILGIDVNETGPDVKLDFRSLQPTSQDFLAYKSGFQTPYVFFFFAAFGTEFELLQALSLMMSIAGIEIDNVYDFFQNDSKSFRAVGRGMSFSGFPLPSFYSEPDVIYNYPLNYGDKDTSDFSFSISVPIPGGPGYTSSGRRINEVDGWGTITLHTGIYEAIRVKSTIEFNDTVTLPDLGLPFPIPPVAFSYTVNEAKWLAKGKKLPIVQLNITELAFGLPDLIEVVYEDFNRTSEPIFQATSATSGCAPLAVSFSHSSKRTQSVLWNFGDGSTSTEEAPIHTYTKGGYYNVTLTTFDEVSFQQLTKDLLVAVSPFDLAFQVNNTKLPLSEPVASFTNLSDAQGNRQDSYEWHFGDGDISTDMHPSHTYFGEGYYSVSLIGISPEGCRDTLVKENYIQIGDPQPNPPDSADGFQMTTYPNPVNDVLIIEFTSLEPGGLSIELIDMAGKLAYRWTYYHYINGKTKTHWKRPENIAAGFYMLRVKNGTYINTKKIAIKSLD